MKLVSVTYGNGDGPNEATVRLENEDDLRRIVNGFDGEVSIPEEPPGPRKPVERPAPSGDRQPATPARGTSGRKTNLSSNPLLSTGPGRGGSRPYSTPRVCPKCGLGIRTPAGWAHHEKACQANGSAESIGDPST